MTLPLAPAWYVNPEIHNKELRNIFEKFPAFLGTVSQLPGIGSFATLPQIGNSKVLVRGPKDIALVSNICAHRQMTMLKGSGTVKSIVCPMHRWTYDLHGAVISAPHYPSLPNTCLPSTPVLAWNGLIFSKPDLAKQMLDPLLKLGLPDASSHALVATDTINQRINWKIPVEAFLENYHVPAIHKGLSRFIHPQSCFGESDGLDSQDLVYQVMQANPGFASNPHSELYDRWQRKILKLNDGALPSPALVVAFLFPSTLLEWYPHMLVVTAYHPVAADSVNMIRHYCVDRTTLLRDPEYADVAIAAWRETQLEDEELFPMLHAGRSALAQSPNEAREQQIDYQSPSEDSIRFFHSRLNAVIHSTRDID